MQDEPLTPEEQDALKRLPREMPPPAALEDATVGRLRAAGYLPPARARWWTAAAAAVLLLAAGFGLGRMGGPTSAPSSDDPQFLLLLYGGEPAAASEEAARVAEYAAWAGEQRGAGRLVTAARLETTRRVLGASSGAPTAANQPSGFFLIRAADADQAAVIAAECPHVRYGGTVVVRRLAN